MPRFANLLLIFLFSCNVAIGQQAVAQGGGGQTIDNVSGWTIDTIKSYFDDILALKKEILELHVSSIKDSQIERDLRYEQRFQAQESASVYTRNIQNEFRGSLNDLSATKLPRTEFDVALKGIGLQIAEASKVNADKMDAMSKANATAFTDIQHRLDITQGNSQGSGTTWANIFAVVGAATALVGIIFVVITRSKTTR